MSRNYPPGFNYVKGGFEHRTMPVSSTGTFVRGVALAPADDGTVIQYADGEASVVGISLSDSSQSYVIVPGTNLVDVLVPEPNTEFELSCVSDFVDSDATAYGAYNLLIDEGTSSLAEVLSIDADSNVTKIVQVVPREDGASATITESGSNYSTIRVRFVAGILSPFNSHGTTIVP